MSDRIVSTAVLTLSRQQEEFLARYRTYEAQKAYFESYGLGVTPFFRGGGGSHGVISPSPEPELPYDYEVEYLEVITDSIDCYVDTGYIPEGDDIIFSIGVQITSYKNFSVLFSNYVASSTRLYAVVASDLSYLRINYNSNDSVGFKRLNISPYTITEKLDLTLNQSNLIVNDITLNSSVNQVGDISSQSVWLFNNPVLPRQLYGKLYYFKIENAGEIVLDLIPVSKEGVGFMYDKVSGKLFESQGGGSFVVGPRK